MSKYVRDKVIKIREMSVPAKATFAYLICSFLQRGISTLTTPIFTRLLNTDQYGYYSIFNSWLDIVAVFTTLKLGGAVFTQALVKFDKERDIYTASTAGLGTSLSLLVFLIYFPIRSYVNRWMGISTDIMVCIIIASWATMIFELWAAKQRVEYKYKSLVALSLFTSIAKPISGIVAILCVPNEFKAQARIISLVVVEVVSYTWIFFVFLKKGKGFYHNRYWRYSLSLNIPLIPHYLTRTILNQCDRLMIRSMIGLGSAGIYSLAYNLAWMLTLFTNAILSTFNPWIYTRIKNKEYKQIGKMSYALLGVVAILGLGLISLAPEVIKIFATDEYYDAIWIIPPVTASVYFLFQYSLFSCFEFYFEKTEFVSIASTVGGILNVILNYFCIQIFGYIAAGYTTLICYILFAVGHYWAMRRIQIKNKIEEKSYNVSILLGISITFLAGAAIMMATYEMVIIRYSIILVAAVIVFVKRMQIIAVIKEIRTKE